MALVYSTETGRTCPACRNALAQCSCKNSVVQGDGKVTVARQTKGRGGKCVTVVSGVALDAMALALLGKQLRAACGAGGTVKDGLIEVQGDHCDKLMDELHKLGLKPKRVGA